MPHGSNEVTVTWAVSNSGVVVTGVMRLLFQTNTCNPPSGLAWLKLALERKATWVPLALTEGLEFEMAWPGVEVVLVNWLMRPRAMLYRNTSWLPSLLLR